MCGVVMCVVDGVCLLWCVVVVCNMCVVFICILCVVCVHCVIVCVCLMVCGVWGDGVCGGV